MTMVYDELLQAVKADPIKTNMLHTAFGYKPGQEDHAAFVNVVLSVT